MIVSHFELAFHQIFANFTLFRQISAGNISVILLFNIRNSLLNPVFTDPRALCYNISIEFFTGICAKNSGGSI